MAPMEPYQQWECTVCGRAVCQLGGVENGKKLTNVSNQWTGSSQIAKPRVACFINKEIDQASRINRYNRANVTAITIGQVL